MTYALQCFTNILAEATKHKDRDFYGAWWGSGYFTCFYRNWNKPVNDFLKTYVYKKLVKKYGKNISLAITFTLSAAVHEIIMYNIAKCPYPYISTTMILLIPIIMFQKANIIYAPRLIVLLNYWIMFFTVCIANFSFFPRSQFCLKNFTNSFIHCISFPIVSICHYWLYYIIDILVLIKHAIYIIP